MSWIFSKELALHIRWPRYWNFSLSISPSNEYSVLISFRIDWLDLLAVHGTLKCLLHTTVQKHQFFSASVLLYGSALTSVDGYWRNQSFDCTHLCWQSVCFLYAVQVCHSYPSKAQASFNFMALVTVCSDFGTQENNICHCFYFFPICLPWSGRTGCHDLNFLNVKF